MDVMGEMVGGTVGAIGGGTLLAEAEVVSQPIAAGQVAGAGTGAVTGLQTSSGQNFKVGGIEPGALWV